MEGKITKSNHLIEASYRLTLNEQRLILACISKIDPTQPIPKAITIEAREFAATYGIDEKHAYEALSDAADNLYERDIRTYDGLEKDRFRWVDRTKYHEKQGRVTLYFTSHIAPYVTLLNRQFTSYQMRQVAGLKSVYSIRLFEMMMQFKKTGELIIPVDDFKERLQIQDKYPRFFDLKKRIIVPAVTELQSRSDLAVSWKPLKKKSSREYDRLMFTFRPADQMSLGLS